MSLATPPNCPAHPDQVADGACSRCGGFSCRRCLAGEPLLCGECHGRGLAAQWEASERRRGWRRLGLAVALLSLSGALFAAGAWVFATDPLEDPFHHELQPDESLVATLAEARGQQELIIVSTGAALSGVLLGLLAVHSFVSARRQRRFIESLIS